MKIRGMRGCCDSLHYLFGIGPGKAGSGARQGKMGALTRGFPPNSPPDDPGVTFRIDVTHDVTPIVPGSWLTSGYYNVGDTTNPDRWNPLGPAYGNQMQKVWSVDGINGHTYNGRQQPFILSGHRLGTIYRHDLDGTNPVQILDTMDFIPGDPPFDHAGAPSYFNFEMSATVGKFFGFFSLPGGWYDEEEDDSNAWSCDLDGSNIQKFDMSFLRSELSVDDAGSGFSTTLAIDYETGKVYFEGRKNIEAGYSRCIVEADMDGTNQVRIYTVPTNREVRGICIQYTPSKRVWAVYPVGEQYGYPIFGDSDTEFASMDVDGGNVSTFFEPGLGTTLHPVNLQFSEKMQRVFTLYWSTYLYSYEPDGSNAVWHGTTENSPQTFTNVVFGSHFPRPFALAEPYVDVATQYQ